jgi:transaldolase
LVVPQVKTVLKGKRFEDTDAIQKNATCTLHTIPKDSFKKVSCSGRTAGSSVSVHKESILKIMKYF